MTSSPVKAPDQLLLQKQHLQLLLDALICQGYQVIGPTLGEGAIIYSELTSVSQLPIGWTDEQEGGSYRLKRREDGAFFGYVVGPQSWKQLLHPPVLRLWSAKREGAGFVLDLEKNKDRKLAFLGVRACELKAIALQDKILGQGIYRDSGYLSRRRNIFTIAVNCGEAGGNCFCSSMNTGPEAVDGFDLALTEVVDADRHYFVVQVGTNDGASILQKLPHKRATKEEIGAAASRIQNAAAHMGRTLHTSDLKTLFYRNYEHPRWDETAQRCLSCANCTMVCPTCFCTTVEDVTDLSGSRAERWRKWDSCFTTDFSYIHGGSVRVSSKSRYRQWLTHKLATWIDQFGALGCVGCGRCITWCPVAIDLTEEVRIIRESDSGDSQIPSAKEKSDGNT